MLNKVTALFARAVIGGKKSAKVDARVSDELKEGMLRRRIELGFRSESEYVDYVLSVDVFGAEHLQMVHESRLRAVCKSSDISRQPQSEVH
jgi:hypothetical protein